MSLKSHRSLSSAYVGSLIAASVLLIVALGGVSSRIALAASGDEFEVSGAGSAEVNGVYTEQANFGWGGAQFTFDNGGTTYYLCNDNAVARTCGLSPTTRFIA